jgi:hypothetical protein
VNSFLKEKLKPFYVNIYNKDSLPGMSSDNVPYMFDDHHVTGYGAKLIVQKVLADSVASGFFHAVMN